METNPGNHGTILREPEDSPGNQEVNLGNQEPPGNEKLEFVWRKLNQKTV